MKYVSMLYTKVLGLPIARFSASTRGQKGGFALIWLWQIGIMGINKNNKKGIVCNKILKRRPSNTGVAIYK